MPCFREQSSLPLNFRFDWRKGLRRFLTGRGNAAGVLRGTLEDIRKQAGRLRFRGGLRVSDRLAPGLLFGLFLPGGGFGRLGCRFGCLGGFFCRAFVDGVPGPVPFVHVHGAGGQERYGSVQVILVRHFNDLVNVAGGNGDGPGNGAARNKLLHGSGVRAACRQHFHLPFDLVGVRHGLHTA